MIDAPHISAQAIAAALGQFPPTAAQQQVIESPLEPALVIAGAGSGKTETMAARVVWLVANRHVAREEILGLTFTRKAAGELAERVQKRLERLDEFDRAGLLSHLPRLHGRGALDRFSVFERAGDDDARRQEIERLAEAIAVSRSAGLAEEDEPSHAAARDLLTRPTIATYNSFADSIVREHAVRAGRDPEAVLLSESAAWLLMRRVVLSSDDERLEGLTESLPSIIDAALRVARDAVDNNVPLDELDDYARKFDRVMTLPSTSARTSVYADVVTAAQRVRALPVLTALAREYDRAKSRSGVLDFSDQVAGALSVVRASDAIGLDLHTRYRVVLLDEYQDTSVSQTALLSQLFCDSAVMAVGDPHQAIYGWRGASAGNLSGFGRAFASRPTAPTYTLLTSWRNSIDVLKVANKLLDPLVRTSEISVGTLAASAHAPRGNVNLVWEHSLDDEAVAVATWFSQIRAQRGTATTGAILFRAKKHMVRFADALAQQGIPHRILGLGGLLSAPEVVDVVSALRVVCEPTAGSPLIRLLTGPRWSIGLPDMRVLAQLARRLARHDLALQPLSPEVAEKVKSGADNDRGALSDALDFVVNHDDSHRWLSDFTPQARERLREAGAVFAGLRRAAGSAIPDLIRMIESELRLDIELASHESRGPARTSSAQLRAFLSQVQSFLAADDAGSLSSLLAWLDNAEKRDEFAVRTEPPEPDVVQLLTIHGSKGLEWDAVAVVRLVKDELPSASKNKKGWLSFGVLPYDFRGDADWLPRFAWQQAETQQDLKEAMRVSEDGHAARQLEEDRRLAYVAVTRAREHLLLSGSSWSGLTKPRDVSTFLLDAATSLGLTLDIDDPGENPYQGEARVMTWPHDALGARRQWVTKGAEIVIEAMQRNVALPLRDTALLLAEREAARQPAAQGAAPVRIPASRYKDFEKDYAGTVADIDRPMPERPYRQTRRGTLFHAWVEQRSDRRGISSPLDDAVWEFDDGDDSSDPEELADLQRTFENSEWGPLRPIAVELEINFAFTGLDDRPHIAICKLDAVYERADRGGRIEIVDWKTGAAPTTQKERDERMRQIELYREAYHQKFGIPRGEIDVALYYVAQDIVMRG